MKNKSKLNLPRVKVKMPRPQVIPNKKRNEHPGWDDDYVDTARDPGWDDGDIGAACAKCGHPEIAHFPHVHDRVVVLQCYSIDADGPCLCRGFTQ